MKESLPLEIVYFKTTVDGLEYSKSTQFNSLLLNKNIHQNQKLIINSLQFIVAFTHPLLKGSISKNTTCIVFLNSLNQKNELHFNLPLHELHENILEPQKIHIKVQDSQQLGVATTSYSNLIQLGRFNNENVILQSNDFITSQRLVGIDQEIENNSLPTGLVGIDQEIKNDSLPTVYLSSLDFFNLFTRCGLEEPLCFIKNCPTDIKIAQSVELTIVASPLSRNNMVYEESLVQLSRHLSTPTTVSIGEVIEIKVNGILN